MQNDKMKCGLSEAEPGHFVDDITTDAYVWFEQGWRHDDYQHRHQRYQLTFVEEGYQYFHIEKRIYLVPQNHVIWIPSAIEHRTSSEAKTVNLMLILFREVLEGAFYQEVHVFPAPPVLRAMLFYAAKWNKSLAEDTERAAFLKAMLTSLPSFCDENKALQIPVPADERLIPVCNFINAQYSKTLDINELADQAKMSVRSLQRIFKHETGITPQKYIQLIRILKSIELIDQAQYTLSQIAVKVGYKSLPAFTASFFDIMKQRPKIKR